MIGKLYLRLSLAMLCMFIVLGVALILISRHTSELYSLEITQRINRDIALHAAEDMPLLQDGVVNDRALKDLAHHVMFINPIVEVYLLDIEGRVLSHALPYETVLLDRVDMTPLRQFMAEDAQLPIFGQDPRTPGEDKVFSVSPITEQGQPVAYLYTVLNGKSHDSLRESLGNSYILSTAASAISGSLLLAGLAGMIIFALLTRRLQKLIHSVRVYRKGSFRGEIDLPQSSHRQDEVDELSDAILAMGERIETQFAALQEVDNTRRELIANVSHDLRTPLASMQGYLETILAKDKTLDDKDRHHYLEVAYKHSRRLNQLIGELFDLAKLESGTMQPNWESFPLMELVQDLVQDYELQARERSITLSAQCTELEMSVYADIALIHRVLENLLQNALRHTRAGGEIVMSVHRDDNKVWVEVIDNGEGIASHEIPHIFDRFYRPDNSTDNQTGLGLAIVKRILDLHFSQVDVVSKPNSGTAFKFWLPQPA